MLIMRKKDHRLYYITVFLLACLVFGLMFHYYIQPPGTPEKFLAYLDEMPKKNDIGLEGSCSVKSCGALDPVSDPAYNMKNVIKQSILLEEHLAEDDKYCIDCCIKHFLHIQGLVEEAIWLACKKEYPLMHESSKFYKEMFNMWLRDRRGTETRENVLSQLRTWRKKLVEIYYAETDDIVV